ncbi:MAG: ATP-binding protein [Candidatus Margulisbacteria bacterium]|nr:ATP-binding protein [Candidatus Margulisiibacteriota bacterium]
MKNLHHSLESKIAEDLERKMVFISGPRQIGKTTLAKKIITHKKGKYLLYDDETDRLQILQKNFIQESYVCLDELHKFDRWKNFLKGVYDKYKPDLHLIVTGSARLDVYQKSGDSLFGRYYLHQLHPLTLAEINKIPITLPEIKQLLTPHSPLKGLSELTRFSGFPEPFLLASETEYLRWADQRRHLLIKEEFRELTNIQLLSLAEQLMLILPSRIGSLMSYTSLAEDIQVSVPTIQNWLTIFEKLFIVYKILPYSQRITKSLKKQPKYFLWNWTECTSEGPQFENVIASHLYKAVQTWRLLGLAKTELFYVRDKLGREVDFLVTKDGEPWFLVEVKLSDEKLSPSLKYFSKHLNVPGIQLLKKEGVFEQRENCICISANQWLGHLI